MSNSDLLLLVIYAATAMVLVAGMLLLSHVSGERRRVPATATPFESGSLPVGNARLRLSVRFYLIAMFFVIFDLESVFLYAWAIGFRESGWPGFYGACTFIGLLLLALIYLWRTGGLEWGPATRLGGSD